MGYVEESLRLLGVPQDGIVYWPVTQTACHLVADVFLYTFPGDARVPSPHALRWLRTRYLAGAGVLDPRPGERYYIARPPGGWRYVVNDDDVQRRLQQIGFQIVRPETLTVAEQIRLFSTARMIVALHGAGLANLLFAPGAATLEIFGDYGSPDYFAMAQVLKQPYAALMAEPIGQNVRIDPDQLLRAIDQLERRQIAAPEPRLV